MAVRWDNGDYYGKKNKIYFKKLNTMIMNLFTQVGEGQVDNDTLENILKLIDKQQKVAYTVTKLVDTLSINQRMVNIEQMLEMVPVEVLATAKKDYENRQQMR